MNLSVEDGQLFYKLYSALMFHANQWLEVLPDKISSPDAYEAIHPEKRLAVRNELFDHRYLIDQFVDENPALFTPDELEIVATWKNALVGTFYIFRYLKRHTIFLQDESGRKAYGVIGLADSLEDLVGPHLPVFTNAVLLPFKGQIIYDGLLTPYSISFGPGIRGSLNEDYKQTKSIHGVITQLPFEESASQPDTGSTSSRKPSKRKAKSDLPAKTHPLRLTQAQRRVVAQLLPELKPRLELDAVRPKSIPTTFDEMETIILACRDAIGNAKNGIQQRSMRLIIENTNKAQKKSHDRDISEIPVKERIYQLRISLDQIEPEIWRRIQIKNCSLDQLHDYIQSAMGWDNYHLHQFRINGVCHGDPELLCEGFEDDPEMLDSCSTQLSHVLPRDGSRFAFQYEYDFGDGWEHEILFEGCLQAEPKKRYPICVEGSRACPPEDVGGTWGYVRYLETITNADHPEHDEMLDWYGPFHPEEFDPKKQTKQMRKK